MVADSLNKCKIVHSIQYGLGIQPNFVARVVASIFKAALRPALQALGLRGMSDLLKQIRQPI